MPSRLFFNDFHYISLLVISDGVLRFMCLIYLSRCVLMNLNVSSLSGKSSTSWFSASCIPHAVISLDLYRPFIRPRLLLVVGRRALGKI